MTAPTLPAMSVAFVRDLINAHFLSSGNATTDDMVQRFARAIIAARDAQWAARLDVAVMDERAECARLVETQSANGDYGVENWFHYLADRIRARTNEKQRCGLCDYVHGHAIGCDNNPVDIALRARTKD